MKYTFVFLLFSVYLTAQEFRLGDISKTQLEQQYHPTDSTAPAAVLNHDGHLSLAYTGGWLYYKKVSKRLKIYNSKGFDYATISIPYFNSESIEEIKEYIYNLEDGKINREKVKRKNILDTEMNEGWNEVKFTFPNLKPGSIIEYTYLHKSPLITLLPEWKFQEDIPVNSSIYEVILPKMFGYNERFKGYHNIEKIIDEREDVSSGMIRVNALIFKYIAKNIPRIKKEAFVNNYENYLSSVQHELAVFKNPNSGKLVDFKTSWEKVAKELELSEEFGSQLKKTKYFEDEVKPIILQNISDQEKITTIFNLVKDKITWNKTIGIYCTDNLKNIYNEGNGSVADINIMLTSMLRYAGFNAHPVILSTIDNGAPPTIPSTRSYNYVISAVELENDKLILLDASDEFAIPDVLPTRCLNFFGRLVRHNYTSKQVELFPNNKSKDSFIMNLSINPNGELSGQLRRRYTNQFAYEYRKKFKEVEKNEYILNLENELDIDVVDLSSKYINEPLKPVEEIISFNVKNASDFIGDKIYLKPLSFLTHEENPFKLDMDDRKLPINFTFPKSRRYIVNVTYPKEFKIEFLPGDFSLDIIENKINYSFNINVTNQGNLQIMVNQNINSIIFGPQYYQAIKEFFGKIVEKETELIVLTKT